MSANLLLIDSGQEKDFFVYKLFFVCNISGKGEEKEKRKGEIADLKVRPSTMSFLPLSPPSPFSKQST